MRDNAAVAREVPSDGAFGDEGVMKPYTGVLGEIEAEAGRDVANKIAGAKGGSRVFIPGIAREGHWLTDLVGLEAAHKVCWLFRGAGQGGSYVKIPRGEMTFYQLARQKIDTLLEKGISLDKIALETGVDISTVQRRRKALGLKPATPAALQLGLFA